MLLYLWIYLIDIIDSLNDFFVGIGAILFGLCVSAMFIHIMYSSDADDYLKDITNNKPYLNGDKQAYTIITITKPFRNPIWFVICFLIAVIVPSKQSLYMMSGIYLGKETIQVVENSELGKLSYQAIEKWLKEYVNEPSKKENTK